MVYWKFATYTVLLIGIIVLVSWGRAYMNHQIFAIAPSVPVAVSLSEPIRPQIIATFASSSSTHVVASWASKQATPTPTATALAPTPTPTFVPTRSPNPRRRSLYLPIVLQQSQLALRNGDFELGEVGWKQYSSATARLIVTRTEIEGALPRGGEWAAWLGGLPGEISELSQRVIVPVDQPVLEYWYAIVVGPGCGRDRATVLVNQLPHAQFFICTPGDNTWRPDSVDLSTYAGMTIDLTFRVEIDQAPVPSNFYLDDIRWISVEAVSEQSLRSTPHHSWVDSTTHSLF